MTAEKIFIAVLAFIGLALLFAIAIHRIREWWRIRKMFAPLRKIVPNIERTDDGFRLHELPALVRKPRNRPSNVTAIKPKTAA